MNKYSFLLSVYKNSKVDEMIPCIESLINQTVKASEIVIVIDGAIPNELSQYLDSLVKNHPELFKLVPLSTNVGLGNALREGMKCCENELIARMDTDDICVLDRCEKQLKCFENDENLSVVGSNIVEFEGDVTNTISFRNVPETHDEICKYLKSRCPLNHVTVMFKKTEVEKAGGYQQWHYNEDSFLWARMFLAGCKFYNLQENLAYARIDPVTFRRRGGWKYYKSERDLFKFMKNNKIISWFGYIKAIAIRFTVQVLMPNKVRAWVFKKFARN